MASGAGGLSLRAMGRGPWATFVWGESRPVVNRVLYAMVTANDPSPFWLDVRGPGGPETEPGPVELGWIPPERLFLTSEPADARPQDAVGNLALSGIVRADEPPRLLAELTDFLRLPPIAQEIVSRLERTEPPHAVAVANGDRVRRDYPTDPAGVRHVLDPFLSAPLLPFFSATAPAGEGRWAFDFVFRVEAESLASWEKGDLVAEKAPADSGVSVDRPARLSAVPGIPEAMRRGRM